MLRISLILMNQLCHFMQSSSRHRFRFLRVICVLNFLFFLRFRLWLQQKYTSVDLIKAMKKKRKKNNNSTLSLTVLIQLILCIFQLKSVSWNDVGVGVLVSQSAINLTMWLIVDAMSLCCRHLDSRHKIQFQSHRVGTLGYKYRTNDGLAQ